MERHAEHLKRVDDVLETLKLVTAVAGEMLLPDRKAFLVALDEWLAKLTTVELLTPAGKEERFNAVDLAAFKAQLDFFRNDMVEIPERVVEIKRWTDEQRNVIDEIQKNYVGGYKEKFLTSLRNALEHLSLGRRAQAA